MEATKYRAGLCRSGRLQAARHPDAVEHGRRCRCSTTGSWRGGAGPQTRPATVSTRTSSPCRAGSRHHTPAPRVVGSAGVVDRSVVCDDENAPAGQLPCSAGGTLIGEALRRSTTPDNTVVRTSTAAVPVRAASDGSSDTSSRSPSPGGSQLAFELTNAPDDGDPAATRRSAVLPPGRGRSVYRRSADSDIEDPRVPAGSIRSRSAGRSGQGDDRQPAPRRGGR